jgi:hypothetical protein
MRRFRYITGFEKWLNRGLWLLGAISLVFSIFQHVILADSPERIPYGARVGDLLYDLAIAYIAAFAFYLLVVRLPLMRDRATVYQCVEIHLWRVWEESRGLMLQLITMASVGGTHQATPEEWEITRGEHAATMEDIHGLLTCIAPDKDVRMFRSTPDGRQPVTPADWLREHGARAQAINRDLLTLAPYLASRVLVFPSMIDMLRIDKACDDLLSADPLNPPKDLTQLTFPIHRYLIAARQIDLYRRDNFGDRTTAEFAADGEAQLKELYK